MRGAWVVPLFALGGCNQLLGIEDVTVEERDASGAPDSASADPDAMPPDEACDGWDYAPSNVPCTEPNGMMFTIAADSLVTYDTDSGVISVGTAPPSEVVAQAEGGPDVRMIVVDGFTSGDYSLLTVTGSRPLVIVVHGTAAIGGGIRMQNGATTCSGGAGIDSALSAGGGGGGGGGMADVGGPGGPGASAGAGTGGSAAGDDVLRPLVGGCAGGDGGDSRGLSGGAGGVGGAGGGALQIAARDRIDLSSIGSLDVGGNGGTGGTGGAGGGGGGAGGALLLEAPAIEIDGYLCAGGASGGEGGPMGANGAKGGCLPATTSNGSAAGGNGGSGGVNGDLAGAPGGGYTGSNGGGGGGGGAAGRIHLRGEVSGAPTQFNPAWTEASL
jgi:hypothetical protein